MSTSVPSAGADRAVRVLVGDDDRRVRAALARLLSVAGGFEVSAVPGNTGDVLRLAEEHHPDVAIVDLLQPDADNGLHLVVTLRKMGVPVVAMSAYSGLRSAALTAGATSFVHKEGKPEMVLDAVRGAVSPPDPLSTP